MEINFMEVSFRALAEFWSRLTFFFDSKWMILFSTLSSVYWLSRAWHAVVKRGVKTHMYLHWSPLSAARDTLCLLHIQRLRLPCHVVTCLCPRWIAYHLDATQLLVLDHCVWIIVKYFLVSWRRSVIFVSCCLPWQFARTNASQLTDVWGFL